MINYVFAGSDSVAATVLEELVSFRKPSLVITRADAPAGRKKDLRQTAVAEVAEKYGIQTVKSNDPSIALEQIKDSGASRGIVVSYGAILKGDVLESLDWFNLHFSLLPRLRGAAPVQRSIISGESPTGVTIFKIDSGMDTGPIYTQMEVDIEGLDTKSALVKMSSSSISLLRELLDDENPSLQPQSGTPSHAAKLTREECQLDFNLSAPQLVRIVRAANPEPMAWTTNVGQPLRILEASTNGVRFPGDDAPGKVELVGGKVFVVCADSTRLELITVQPFSKKSMSARDWYNGVKEATVGN